MLSFSTASSSIFCSCLIRLRSRLEESNCLRPEVNKEELNRTWVHHRVTEGFYTSWCEPNIIYLLILCTSLNTNFKNGFKVCLYSMTNWNVEVMDYHLTDCCCRGGRVSCESSSRTVIQTSFFSLFHHPISMPRPTTETPSSTSTDTTEILKLDRLHVKES